MNKMMRSMMSRRLRIALAACALFSSGYPAWAASSLAPQISVELPAAAPFRLPAETLARNLDLQLRDISIEGTAPEALVPQLIRSLETQIQAGTTPRDQALAAQAWLTQGLSDPRALADRQKQLRDSTPEDPALGERLARSLGELSAAVVKDEAAQEALKGYDAQLRHTLSAVLSGDETALGELFDRAIRASGNPQGAVLAQAPSTILTGSQLQAQRPREASLRHPLATDAQPLEFSPRFMARNGSLINAYGETTRDEVDRQALTEKGAFGEFPLLTQIHLQSWAAQLKEWLAEGLISRPIYNYLLGLTRDHDRAYVINTVADVESREAGLKKGWTAIGLAVHGEPARAAREADEAYAFMRRAFDIPELQKEFRAAGLPDGMAFGYKALVGTIIGHGSMSIPDSMARFKAAGFLDEPALAMALLVAAHHPNFPITMVLGFAGGLTAKTPSLAIPNGLLSLLLAREGRDSDAMLDSESLRAKVAAHAAGILGISAAEARFIALMGYSLDRVTAARRNYPDARDFRQETKNGKTINSFVRWNKPGASFGEIVKKYGLILTNIMSAANIKTSDDVRKFTLQTAFEKTLESITGESNSAKAAINLALTELGATMTEGEKRQFENLLRDVEQRSSHEIAETRKIQGAVQRYIQAGNIPGFSGLIVDIDADIDRVAAHARALAARPDQSENYETVSYLLSALVAIQTGNTNQATLTALKAVPRP